MEMPRKPPKLNKIYNRIHHFVIILTLDLIYLSTYNNQFNKKINRLYDLILQDTNGSVNWFLSRRSRLQSVLTSQTKDRDLLR